MKIAGAISKLNLFVPSEQLIYRIKNSYRKALKKEVNSLANLGSPIWSDIDTRRRDIHEALLSDGDELKGMLSDPISTNLYYGVDNLAADLFGGMQNDDLSLQANALFSQIYILLESIGINKSLPNGCPVPSIDILEEYLSRLEQFLKFQLKFPNPFRGEIGIVCSRGIISYRVISSIYQSYLISQYSKSTFIKRRRNILEIGGGMGRVAFYCYPNYKFTIIDLPMAIVGQALFLSATLGEDCIWMVGDKAPKENRVLLLPPSELESKNSFMMRSYDCILNADSLTEMNYDSIEKYLKFINKNSKVFISINHEGNPHTVNEAMKSLSSFSFKTRYPNWLRQGWVDEIFHN
jgi:hypothetical protein